jgi:hypothetical protein
MLGLISTVFSALAKLLPALLAFIAGRRAAERDALKEAAEILNAQRDIASAPDAGRHTLLERMRSRGWL